MVSDKAAKKLGFDVVTGQLRESLASSMGAEELNALHPAACPEVRRESLMLTDALQSRLLCGETLPLQDCVDVRHTWKRRILTSPCLAQSL